MPLFPIHAWRIVLLDIEFVLDCFFPPVLEKCTSSFWPPCFQMRNLSFKLVLLYRYCVRFLWQLSSFFSLSLVFTSLVMMCFGMDSFGIILFGVHSASWICKFVCFAKIGKFSAIISLAPLSFSSPSGILMTPVLHVFYCPTGLWVSFHLY